jgi:hypothetical protein
MDADYGRNRDRDGGPFTTFEPRLFVWATVMSRPAEDRAIVDAGLKALASTRGRRSSSTSAATYERASDEHGRLAVSAATNRLELGDKIRLTPVIATRPSTPTLPSPDHRPRRGLLSRLRLGASGARAVFAPRAYSQAACPSSDSGRELKDL